MLIDDNSKKKVKNNPYLKKIIYKNNIVFSNSEEERKKLSHIDEIVKAFSDSFKYIDSDDILEALKMNSFDICDTYFYLSAPEKFKCKFFNQK